MSAETPLDPDQDPIVKITLRLPTSFRDTLKIDAIQAGQTLQDYTLECVCRGRGTHHAVQRDAEAAGDGGT
jgi:hypothetical protein